MPLLYNISQYFSICFLYVYGKFKIEWLARGVECDIMWQNANLKGATMRKPKRRRSVWSVISFFLAAALIVAIAVSVVNGWKKLSGYGDSTTIGSAASETETPSDAEQTTGGKPGDGKCPSPEHL